MKTRNTLFLTALLFLLASCTGKQTPLEVQPSQIHGTWIQTGTQKYWTYYANGTGNKVDRDEFEEDDENNGDFEWTLVEDELQHVFHGRQGNQNIPKYYTITYITSNSMRWRDEYSRPMSFSKVRNL